MNSGILTYRQWRQLRLYLALFCFAMGMAPLMAHAQLQGAPILDGQFDIMKEISANWRDLYDDTFTNGGSPVFTSVVLVAWMVFSAMTVPFLWNMFSRLSFGDDFKPYISPIIIIAVTVMLLGQNAKVPVEFARGMILMKDNVVKTTLSASVGQVRAADAIKDSLLTGDAKNRIQQQLRQCEAIATTETTLPSRTRPTNGEPLTAAQDALYRHMECYDKLGIYVGNLKRQYERTACGVTSINVPGIPIPAPVNGQACAGTRRFLDTFGDALRQGIATEWEKILNGKLPNPLGVQFSLADNLAGNASVPILKFWLTFFQRLYVDALNATYFLTVLTVPIAVGFMYLPGSQNSLISWLTILFGALMAEFYYAVILGISALIIAKSTTGYFSDIQFALMAGFFAPIISGGLALMKTGAIVGSLSSAAGRALGGIPVVGGLGSGLVRLKARG